MISHPALYGLYQMSGLSKRSKLQRKVGVGALWRGFTWQEAIYRHTRAVLSGMPCWFVVTDDTVVLVAIYDMGITAHTIVPRYARQCAVDSIAHAELIPDPKDPTKYVAPE